MSRLEWLTSETERIGPHTIPRAAGLPHQGNNPSGIRRDSPAKHLAKRVLWPFRSAYHSLLVDGFVERTVGAWIRRLATDDTAFLEVGCGDMSLRRFLPPGVCYNAFDLSLSAFQLLRVLGRERRPMNIALASACAIPLDSETASMIVSTEVLEHIPDVDAAVREIHRVARPGARFICSIPNNLGHKYKSGRHPEHVNDWTFDQFQEYMAGHGFRCEERLMKGYWVPVHLPFVRAPIQLPVSSKREYENTNFFYLFQVEK
ncbi:MAG: methyltransferase domain-containing protein [Candidatus Hydrogenedentes bacterium]|nr:methyltransferase domain-containing protein [Candidatus Hydrogenedentota bacterium]